ncbi:endolytic transglycosylase MltG [Rickettsiales bacterium]|nr:endolytic transglycosylase MltG [Rickettsiales bacterium]
MAKRFFYVAIAFLTILILYIYILFNKKVNVESDTIFIINNGETSSSVISRLQEQQIINNNFVINLFVKLESRIVAAIVMKSGEYSIKANDSLASILKMFHNNDIVLRQITFIEGMTTAEIVNITNQNEYLAGTVNIEVREGYLFPDTYFFARNTTKDELLNIMFAKTNKLLDQFWDLYKYNIPLKTKDEVLVMASIIEKETGANAERELVSGVFYNRLKKNMRLQSDPTVIYAVTKGQYKLDRQLSKRDLRKKSVFNTYTTRGLPPTPIANPGYKALFAAFNPAETKFLYFVANGDGGHNFASNLNDHNKNVQILRKIERNRKIKNENK